MPGAETPSTVQLPRNGAYELYEYPARALDTHANERASKLRMQSVEADHEAFSGASTVRDLKPGAKLTPFDIADPSNAFETAAIASITHRTPHALPIVARHGPTRLPVRRRRRGLPGAADGGRTSVRASPFSNLDPRPLRMAGQR